MTAETMTKAECAILTVERRLTAVARAQASIPEIAQVQRSLRRKINVALGSLDVGPLGPTCTLWRPLADGRLDLEPGVLVARAFDPVGEVVSSALPAGRAVHLLYVGPYEGLSGAWQTLLAWCKQNELELAGINWEIYENADSAPPETALYALLA
jgi:hypothetical protein